MSEDATDANDLSHKVRQVELLISNLLRIGVIASLAVIVIGTVVTFAHHADYERSRAALRDVTDAKAKFPSTLSGVAHGVAHGEGRAIVSMGLLLLIATPVLRVAVSIFAFVYEKDAMFVCITSVVLALLLLSFALGKGEG